MRRKNLSVWTCSHENARANFARLAQRTESAGCRFFCRHQRVMRDKYFSVWTLICENFICENYLFIIINMIIGIDIIFKYMKNI